MSRRVWQTLMWASTVLAAFVLGGGSWSLSWAFALVACSVAFVGWTWLTTDTDEVSRDA